MSSGESIQYNNWITQKKPAEKIGQQPQAKESKDISLFNNDAYSINFSGKKDEQVFHTNHNESFMPSFEEKEKSKDDVKFPYFNSEMKKEYNEKTVVDIYKSLSNKEVSNQNSKELVQNIHRLTQDNYKFALTQFDNADLPLTDAIMDTSHLSLEEKKKCMKHLVDVGQKTSDLGNQRSDDIIPNMKEVIKKYETSDLNETEKRRLTADFRKILYRSDTLKTEIPIRPNGKLDGEFQQGNTNDCWLLAGIKGLSMTKEGKTVLENAIKPDGKGNVDVTFKGIGKTYKITARDLKGSNELSSGDSDIRALEIAMDRHFRETLPDGVADINENSVSKAFELLADPKKTKSAQGYDGVSQIIDEIQKTGMKGKASVTGMSGDIDPTDIDAVNENGDFVEMYTCHAYTLKGVDKEYAYLINPHNSSETIKIPLEQYKEKFNLLSLTDVKGLK